MVFGNKTVVLLIFYSKVVFMSFVCKVCNMWDVTVPPTLGKHMCLCYLSVVIKSLLKVFNRYLVPMALLCLRLYGAL